MQIAVVIIAVGAFVFLAHLFAAVFARTRIPDVLFLIVLGLLLGPVFHVVRPEHLGMVGPVFTGITLALILFESGSSLQLGTLGRALAGGLGLTVLGFALSAGAVGVAARLLTGMGWTRSLMLGAIVGGTSSAVVIPMVRALKMEGAAGTMLVLESAASDVLCIVVALALLRTYELGGLAPLAVGINITLSFLVAAVVGLAGGFLWASLLGRIRTLQNPVLTTPAFVFLLYGAVELLGFSGAIAALAFGITVGSRELLQLPFLRRGTPTGPVALNETERSFFAEIVFLLKTFFFVYLGVSIQFGNPVWILLGLALTLLMFALRIPVVRILAPASSSPTDASTMAVMVPKGLAAAVLASIPLQHGIESGDLIQNLTYAIVLFSIVTTSALVFLVSRTGLSKVYAALLSRPRDRPPD